MAVAAPLAPLPRSEAGDVRFVSQGELLAATETLDEQGWLIAKPAALCAAHRSRLAHLFEEAVELGLQQRQAPPAGVAASSDLDGSLSDQLYRARAVGAKGICVYVPPLLRITGAAGALDAEDSAILRWWMTATTERPVRLLIHAENRALGVYGPPLLLQTLLEAGTDAWRSAPAPCTDRLEASTREAMASKSAEEAAVTPATAPASEADDTRAGSLHEPIRAEAADSDHASGSTPVALYPEAAERWQDWQRELERARGPKPLSVVERLFVSAYLPLLEARLSGEAPSSAQDTLDAWAASFEHSYSEAFEALRWRSQRPTMVLDMPDLALRIARLHGARSVQLILVDSMRFDLGQRINNHLGLLLSRHAALTEQLLLWAALPATTSVQLDLLGLRRVLG